MVSQGDFVVITGKSGAGKTTLGRLLIKDLVPTSGKIEIDGQDLSKIKNKDIPAFRRKIGFIFQDYKIIPDKTVYENIELALQISGLDKKKIPERIGKLLELVGIPGKENLFPIQLAGGELQRVSIARAIASNPPILFADEPTGNLDKETSIEIFNLLKKINEGGTTIIMATHDVTLIDSHQARHIHLQNGKIVKDHNPNEPVVETQAEPAEDKKVHNEVVDHQKKNHKQKDKDNKSTKD
jgi:cell division transport system ATP-binding protein